MKSKDLKFGIIGGGSWGTALIKIISENINPINWYIRKKENVGFIKKNKHNKNYLSSVNLNIKKLNISSDINKVCEMRIGFRKGEERRQQNMLAKLNKNGNEEIKIVVDKKGNRNKWGMVEWRKPSFPLIDNGIDNKQIQSYWSKNTDVNFPTGYYNNCVGCFHRSPLFLNKMHQEHPNKIEWFAKQEEINKPNTFRKDVNFKQIMQFAPQTELSFKDFDQCDSGYCGL